METRGKRVVDGGSVTASVSITWNPTGGAGEDLIIDNLSITTVPESSGVALFVLFSGGARAVRG